MSMLATDFVFEADGVEICIMFDPAISPNWAQIIETESGEVPDRLGNNNVVDIGKKACRKALPNFGRRAAIKKYIEDKFKVTEVREIKAPISVRHELEGLIEKHK